MSPSLNVGQYGQTVPKFKDQLSGNSKKQDKLKDKKTAVTNME